MKDRTEPMNWKTQKQRKSVQNSELEQELTDALNVSISNLARKYDAILNRSKKKSQIDQHA